jgi:peptide deformylase
LSVLTITTVGDPVLRRPASKVDPEELRSPAVQRLIDDLIDTRRAAGGAGLAANQVSVSKRIAVVEVDSSTRYAYKPLFPLTVIVNPTIEPLSDEQLVINEGCLSVPDLRGDVPRFTEVAVRYLDRAGEPNEIVVHGLTAGTFQHEVDHLDGVLFLDRVMDPRTFSTWAQFERHHQDEFLRRVAPYIRGAAGQDAATEPGR